MKKNFKFSLLGIASLFLLLITIFSINVLKKDFKYAHQSFVSYQDSFNWFSYHLKTKIIKIIIDLKVNNKIGLTAKNLYINNNSIKELLDKTPSSTKKWKQGFYLNEDNSVDNIEIRLKGDNPGNWFFEKKHWRIKKKKDELINRQRDFEYTPFEFQTYLSGKIANSIGLISPSLKLIELFINEESQGTYIESENLNESFLRREKIMPINLYKGEQILAETIIELENNLFNSPGALKKIAYFNQVDVNDKSDLIYLFKLFQLSQNNNVKYSELLDIINLDYWSKFSAYQILTQNFHNDSSHNFRLLSDPWSGYFTPIVHDPLINIDTNNSKIDLDKSSNEMFLLLNKDSSFQNLKLEFINSILNSKLIENEIINLVKIEDKIKISEGRDIENLSADFSIIKLFLSLFTGKYETNRSVMERKIFIKEYLSHISNLKKFLHLKPSANWYKIDHGFEIYVNKEIPISNLKLNFSGEKPNWLAIDLNENKKIDLNEVKIYPGSDQKFVIPYRFYANRIVFSDKTIDLLKPKLKTVATRFRFITDKSILPTSIKYENPFSKKIYELRYKKLSAFPFFKNNQPVDINSKQLVNIKTNPIVFDKIIEVNKTLIINQETIIKSGTTFNIAKGKNIIFKKKVIALGTKDKPIIFKKKSDAEWGTIALQGDSTNNSIFRNVIFDGGSGGQLNNIKYTGALSIHNTKNIELTNINMSNNKNFDDMLHIVYAKNIKIDSINIEDSFMDAIDIDMSNNIEIKNAKIKNSGNDAIDLMESDVIITDSNLNNSKDKAISVGENSFLILNNSILFKNNIGIATKDNSFAFILHTDLSKNNISFNNYLKNWRYGDGGVTKVYKSKLENNKKVKIDKKSTIQFLNSTINNEYIEKSIISKKNDTNHLSILNNNNYDLIEGILKNKGINLVGESNYFGSNL